MSYLFPYAGCERRPIHPKAAPVSSPPAVELVQNEPVPPMPGSLRTVFVEVCNTHRVKPSEMLGSDRNARFVAARRAFIWRARHETDHSFPRIAKVLRRDHTTAVHQFYRVERGEASIEPFVARNPTALNRRETETIELRAAGVPWAEIAARFGINEISVRSYASSAKRKMESSRD